MPQENVNKVKNQGTGDPGRVRDHLVNWLTNNFFFAVLPLFVSYLALPLSKNPAEVLQRGDAFILTAALLAPEIAALRNLKASPANSKINNLLNVMFLLVVLSTVLFMASSADYSATHPEASPSKSKSGTSIFIFSDSKLAPPFPLLSPDVVDTLSVISIIATVVIVYISIRERRSLVGEE